MYITCRNELWLAVTLSRQTPDTVAYAIPGQVGGERQGGGGRHAGGQRNLPVLKILLYSIDIIHVRIRPLSILA